MMIMAVLEIHEYQNPSIQASTSLHLQHSVRRKIQTIRL